MHYSDSFVVMKSAKMAASSSTCSTGDSKQCSPSPASLIVSGFSSSSSNDRLLTTSASTSSSSLMIICESNNSTSFTKNDHSNHNHNNVFIESTCASLQQPSQLITTRNMLPSASTIRSSSNVMLNAVNSLTQNNLMSQGNLINIHNDCNTNIPILHAQNQHQHENVIHEHHQHLQQQQLHANSHSTDVTTTVISSENIVGTTNSVNMNSRNEILLDSTTSPTISSSATSLVLSSSQSTIVQLQPSTSQPLTSGVMATNNINFIGRNVKTIEINSNNMSIESLDEENDIRIRSTIIGTNNNNNNCILNEMNSLSKTSNVAMSSSSGNNCSNSNNNNILQVIDKNTSTTTNLHNESGHQSLIMHAVATSSSSSILSGIGNVPTTSATTIIPTSPIATLSLESTSPNRANMISSNCGGVVVTGAPNFATSHSFGVINSGSNARKISPASSTSSVNSNDLLFRNVGELGSDDDALILSSVSDSQVGPTLISGVSVNNGSGCTNILAGNCNANDGNLKSVGNSMICDNFDLSEMNTNSVNIIGTTTSISNVQRRHSAASCSTSTTGKLNITSCVASSSSAPESPLNVDSGERNLLPNTVKTITMSSTATSVSDNLSRVPSSSTMVLGQQPTSVTIGVQTASRIQKFSPSSGNTIARIATADSLAIASSSSPVASSSRAMKGASRLDPVNLNISTDSLSSYSSNSDDSCIDIDIKNTSRAGSKGDKNENGYQDNTSSNSQQSAGGGGGNAMSGGNSGGGSNGNTGSNGNVNNGNISTGNGNAGYISLIPPPVGTTGTSTQCGDQIDFKHLFEELCPVCGDKVSGYHYGLLTCESCKGFFKRTVQNKKVYTCVAERSCHIDKTQRKRCPYCRFQKCLEVGMKLEAVRADRMRGGRNKFGPMYKRDRARKLQMMRQRQLALQAIRGSMGSTEIKPGQLSPTGYQQTYPNMSIKQEIQIPQVSSLTQSPDSSPSPIAIALGQVNPNSTIIATSLSSGSGTSTTTVSGVGGGTAGSHSSDSGSSTTLQHSSDSKLCFDSGTNPSSTADSVNNVEPLRVSPMIREFVQSIDDREWQTQLFTLLQKQSYNQVEVDLFELMCKVLDQNLFSQVDWARNTVFFKDLKVDDQMKLLQHSWSDMLVLDHLHQRIHNGLPDETPLHNGQIFNLLNLGLLGVPQLADYFNELQNKLQELKFDMGDYVCMKFLILLNPNVRGIINRKTVLEGHENVQAALLDYTLTCYPTVTDKFSRLLSILPEIHAMAARGEEHLYLKHCAGSAPTQTLLMEMLHAKRKV